MVGVGRDLCGASGSTPLSKQGHLEKVAQDLIQASFEYLQRRRIHNLPGQPVPVLRHPQSEVIPHVRLELPVLQFVPVAHFYIYKCICINKTTAMLSSIEPKYLILNSRYKFGGVPLE